MPVAVSLLYSLGALCKPLLGHQSTRSPSSALHLLGYLCRYLNKVDDAVKAAKQATDGPITVLAHSAGGWLSRVYLLVSQLHLISSTAHCPQ